MKISPLIKIISFKVLFSTLSIPAFSQTCSSGTTTVSSAGASTYTTTANNKCLDVTASGSISYAGATKSVVNSSYSGFGITNAGTIASGDAAIWNSSSSANITSITNSGAINAIGFGTALTNLSGTIGTITNNGTMSGGTNGTIIYSSGTINALVNNGTMTSGYDGIELDGAITTLTNRGTITNGTGDAGIVIYSGSITTLNNAQGAGNSSGALTYNGRLPTNYNIIINSPTSYGKLTVTNASGVTTFGIYSGSVVTNGIYSSVLTGVSSSKLLATSGTYGSGTWALSNTSGSIWDLILSGYTTTPSTINTQASLVSTSSSLQNIYTLQNSVLANSFTYDCNVFGVNNICVSAGGRNTAVSAANGLNNTSALLIAGYRINSQYRFGAYADQNLSVNNVGSIVNLGNNTPLIGVFGAWNERIDDLGAVVKVSAAYGQKNATITRAVVGTSEAGSGSSHLNSQGAQVVTKYGFGVMQDAVISPYAGARYTQNNMGGYTEATTASVTTPLTYSALNTNATTVLAGIGLAYKGIPQAALIASAGVESDTNAANGSINATGLSGLTPVNFNSNLVKTRPTASIGAYYDVEKNQRLAIAGIYRQEAYQTVQTTTVMATYTVGL